MRYSLAILSFLFFSIYAFAQNEIQLKNPSFEGTASISQTPKHWKDCGFRGESPPDINPNESIRVTNAASEGNTYLGMVTRSNDTYESICQKLDILLEAGQVYQWEMDVATSKDFFSFDRITRQETNYNEPIVLRVWAGENYC